MPSKYKTKKSAYFWFETRLNVSLSSQNISDERNRWGLYFREIPSKYKTKKSVYFRFETRLNVSLSSQITFSENVNIPT